MGHGHDDHGHGSHAGHAGHGHDDHGHGGGHAAPEAPPPPPPPHVFTIARITRVLGLAMMAVFVAGILYYWLIRPGYCARAWGSAFAALYGLCIWRAAADTLGRESESRPAGA